MIAGLGNPEKKYDGTRHNIGFEAVEYIAGKCGAKIDKSKFESLYTAVQIENEKVILQKPLTYMNLSGNAIAAAAAFYKIPAENIIVLCDDISLDAGILRVRTSGSAGGHNGLKSIISKLGENFCRVKIGVGAKPCAEYDLADWVLSKPDEASRAAITARFDDIFEGVKLIIKGEAQKAQTLCNRKAQKKQ